MIDFHSHILPGIDDGSKNTEESIALLKMLFEQGVSMVIATPHFYPHSENAVDKFLFHRNKALEKLSPLITENMPLIKCGAEIHYYSGISYMLGLPRLCIENTSLLLIEMPIAKWSKSTVTELAYIARSGEFRVVLAHAERYLQMQTREVVEILYESGILMQINADYITRFSSKRKAISMIRDGRCAFIGSDCHDLKYRPPVIGNAFKIIEKKLGKEFIEQFNARNYALFTE